MLHVDYLDKVYEIVKNEYELADLDSIYEDFIVHLVGVHGLNALLEHKLLETCGVINSRQLYVLCEK